MARNRQQKFTFCVIFVLLVGMLLLPRPGAATQKPVLCERIVYQSERPFEDNWAKGHPLAGQHFAFFTNELQWHREKTRLPQRIVAHEGDFFQSSLVEPGGAAVIVAYLGEARTGGYGIAVDEVRVFRSDTDRLVTIVVKRRKPEPTDFVTQAFTYPYDVLALPTDLLPKAPYTVLFKAEDDTVLHRVEVSR